MNTQSLLIEIESVHKQLDKIFPYDKLIYRTDVALPIIYRAKLQCDVNDNNVGKITFCEWEEATIALSELISKCDRIEAEAYRVMNEICVKWI